MYKKYIIFSIVGIAALYLLSYMMIYRLFGEGSLAITYVSVDRRVFQFDIHLPSEKFQGNLYKATLYLYGPLNYWDGLITKYPTKNLRDAALVLEVLDKSKVESGNYIVSIGFSGESISRLGILGIGETLYSD